MWSSEVRLLGIWAADQPVVGVEPSGWTANQNLWSTWLLHITPICPLNAISDEMSSVSMVVEPGTWNGVPHCVSVPFVLLTKTRDPSVHVAQRRPAESLSMTSVSLLMLLIGKPDAGKAESRV